MKHLLTLVLALALCLTAAAASAEMPAVWGMDFAPESYWAQLEAAMAEYGVTPENLEEKKQEWEKQYGEDNLWPQDLFVIYCVLTTPAEDAAQEHFTYPLFLKEEQKGQQEIGEIARQYMNQDAAGQVDQEWLDQLVCCAFFWNDAFDFEQGEYFGHPVWFVQFQAWDTNYWSTRYWAYVSEDGEVLYAELTLDSNG